MRLLYPGEEALVMEAIDRYLERCIINPQKFPRKLFDIVSDILRDCKLSELEDYQLCVRQIETHFMLNATKWRYSGRLNMKDKNLENCLAAGKNNLIDLRKDNVLTRYLLGKEQKNTTIK